MPASDADDVGEVVLPLGVVRREPAQRRSEDVAAEGVDAGVDLVQLELLGAGVALLDDAHGATVGTADDTAVARGVVHHRRQHRRGVGVGDVGGDQLVERLGAQQRGVAGQHDDGRGVVEVVTRDGRHADGSRVTGAALGHLLDEREVGPRGRQLRHLGHHLVGAVADHERGRLRVQLAERVDDVQHHRPAADHVQRLGPIGPHARALAGGEDDGGDGHADLR